MAIPDFQSFFLPTLRCLNDGDAHSTGEINKSLSAILNPTNEDLNEWLPSGKARKFESRASWARTYLKKALTISTIKPGIFQITERGKKIIQSNPDKVSVKVLLQFPEFKEFYRKNTTEVIIDHIDISSPEETLENAFKILRESLANELLQTVKASSPEFFENLVIDLLLKMGYGGSKKEAGMAIGRPGDEGIDGIIKEDKLGLDVIYIQAKRWDGPIGRPEIQKFCGSLDGKKAKKGVFISTSHFTPDAREYVNIIEKRIVLIDGKQLTQFMIDFCIGVSEEKVFTIKKIDTDYFESE